MSITFYNTQMESLHFDTQSKALLKEKLEKDIAFHRCIKIVATLY